MRIEQRIVAKLRGVSFMNELWVDGWEVARLELEHDGRRTERAGGNQMQAGDHE